MITATGDKNRRVRREADERFGRLQTPTTMEPAWDGGLFPRPDALF
jgi:hypothetical protein